MRRRVAVARNLPRPGCCFVVPAAAMGFAGWRLGGYRLALLFGGSVVLLGGGAVLVRRPDRDGDGRRARAPAGRGAGAALARSSASRRGRGVIRPRLYLLADGYPRALSAGRGARGGAALAVSTGLLGVATPAELEGIVAHELAHLRTPRRARADARGRSLAAALVEASRLGGWLAARAALRRSARSPRRSCTCSSRRSGSSRPTASPRSSAARRTASPTRCSGSSSTMELVAFQASPATEPLYTTNPFADEGLAALFVTHPPLGERVRRLRELDPEWREKLRAA